MLLVLRYGHLPLSHREDHRINGAGTRCADALEAETFFLEQTIERAQVNAP